jgi:hypothetical protein
LISFCPNILRVGAETIGEIPTDEWTFVAIVFTNHTAVHDSFSTTTVTDTDTDTTSSLSSALLLSDRDKDLERGLDIAYPADYYTLSSSPSSVAMQEDAERRRTAKGPHEYSISVYFNGKLDVKMDFSQVVISNTFAANFFNDVSFAGASSLLFLFKARLFKFTPFLYYLTSLGHFWRYL